MHYYTMYLFTFFQGKNPVERAHLGRQRHLGCYLAAYSVLKNGKNCAKFIWGRSISNIKRRTFLNEFALIFHNFTALYIILKGFIFG